jgi:hypothetical protein
MEGIDLISEGILTLSKVERILKTYNYKYVLSHGPADQVVKLLLECDDIKFLIGTASTWHIRIPTPAWMSK